MKIAVVGKGGTGKTFVAAVLADQFSRRGMQVLAVDADSSPNLGHMLDIPSKVLEKIVPISDRDDLVKSKTDAGTAGVYRLNFRVDDIVRDYSIRAPNNVSLMVMGTVKTAGEGCTCPANALLRALLRHLIVQHDEAVVLDMEAGLEHMGRRTAEGVDLMIVVSEAGQRSLKTADRLIKLAQDTGIAQIAVIGNKIRDEEGARVFKKATNACGANLTTTVPYDETVEELEIKGISPLIGGVQSDAVAHIRSFAEQILREFEIQHKSKESNKAG